MEVIIDGEEIEAHLFNPSTISNLQNAVRQEVSKPTKNMHP